MDKRIIRINGENMNSFYDPAKDWDGGGYWQPLVSADLDLHEYNRIEIFYVNNGAFGRHFRISLHSNTNTKSFKFYKLDDVKDLELCEQWHNEYCFLSDKETVKLIKEIFDIGNVVAKYRWMYRKDK